MTFEAHPAVQRARTFADAWTATTNEDPDAIIATVHVGRRTWAHLTLGDLRALLAVADPDEQPIGHVPTKAGLNYLATRREQHPNKANR